MQESITRRKNKNVYRQWQGHKKPKIPYHPPWRREVKLPRLTKECSDFIARNWAKKTVFSKRIVVISLCNSNNISLLFNIRLLKPHSLYAYRSKICLLLTKKIRARVCKCQEHRWPRPMPVLIPFISRNRKKRTAACFPPPRPLVRQIKLPNLLMYSTVK